MAAILVFRIFKPQRAAAAVEHCPSVTGINAMSPVDFTTAFYIKLGRGGKWENDSIETGKLRLGWREQSIEDINAGRWELIEEQLRAKDEGKRVPATTSDLNALKIIAASSPEDIWITFHKSKLWWARLVSGPVEQDSISKFRRTAEPWCDHAADGRLLVVNEIPGKISLIQGFRATVCRVKHGDLLRRTLNATRSPLATAIRKSARNTGPASDKGDQGVALERLRDPC